MLTPFRVGSAVTSSARGIDGGPRRFNRRGRPCGLEASRESTMTDGPTRCGRTERTSITDRRIPRSWSKTDSVPKRTSDLEHGQRASLETGRGWRAKSVRHGRKPPPDARRIFRATRFRSETAIPAPGGAVSRTPCRAGRWLGCEYGTHDSPRRSGQGNRPVCRSAGSPQIGLAMP